MRKKLILVLVSAVILSSAALGGCGSKKVTAESLVKEANENAKKVKSFEADMDMDISMNISSEGVGMDMDMGIAGTMQATTEPEVVYMDMVMEASLFGLSMDMDVYTQVEGDKIITYTGVAGEWMKTEEDYVGEEGIQNMQAAFGDGANMTLAEQTEKIGDKEVYVLTSTITGEDLKTVFGQMEALTEGFGEMDFSELQADVTMKIYKDTVLPAFVSVNMSDGGEGTEIDGVITKINSMNIVINYNEFDTIDAIEIPAEALAAETLDPEALLEEAETAVQ